MNLTRGINLRKIAELMPGASGAEVKVIGEPELKGAEAERSEFEGIRQQCLASFLCSGCVHRSRHVCLAGAASPRHAGGL